MDAVIQQSDRLTDLMERLLDVSRIDARKLVLEKKPTDLTQLVARAAAAAQVTTQTHTLSLRTAPALPDQAVVAMVDSFRIEQVVTNLLSNAIKFSPAGGEIAISLETVEAEHVPDAPDAPDVPDNAGNAASRNGALVRLSIRDHGIGIPADRRAHIFERFGQAHSEGHLGGLGLGLYISKQIVEQHAGTIAAEFPEDGGTRFVVSLPMDPAPT